MKATIGCVKAATHILGDKWTPQLLRLFANESDARFSRIQDAVEGINPRTLSARLTTLESEGIIEKVQNPESTRCRYCLTQKGKELIPILQAMESWSNRHTPSST